MPGPARCSFYCDLFFSEYCKKSALLDRVVYNIDANDKDRGRVESSELNPIHYCLRSGVSGLYILSCSERIVQRPSANRFFLNAGRDR